MVFIECKDYKLFLSCKYGFIIGIVMVKEFFWGISFSGVNLFKEVDKCNVWYFFERL